MWELLVSLFGGASIATKVITDKAEQKVAARRFEDEQTKLNRFRESVTNERTVKAVNDLMYSDNSVDAVAKELSEVFRILPELRGKEALWIKSNHRPPASNWYFVELVLCIKRGCVPITKQFSFDISPYYIGNNAGGRPQYVSMSESSCNAFANWATRTLQVYGNSVTLEYRPSQIPNRFVWVSATPGEIAPKVTEQEQDTWTDRVTDMSFEISIKSKLQTADGKQEAEEELRTILQELPEITEVSNGLNHIYLVLLMAKHGKIPMEDACRPFCRYGFREPIEKCTGKKCTNRDILAVHKWLETTLRANGVPDAELIYHQGKFAHGFSWMPFASGENAKRLW